MTGRRAADRRGWRLVLPWLLLAAWMGFIFFMSAQTAQKSAETSGLIARPVARAVTPNFDRLEPPEQRMAIARVQPYVRKSAHALEFAVLGVLLMTAWMTVPLGRRWQVFLSLLMAVLYAAGDEWHQRFVSGRGPMLMDAAIDVAGSLFGVLSVLLFRYVWRRSRPACASLSLK